MEKYLEDTNRRNKLLRFFSPLTESWIEDPIICYMLTSKEQIELIEKASDPINELVSTFRNRITDPEKLLKDIKIIHLIIWSFYEFDHKLSLKSTIRKSKELHVFFKEIEHIIEDITKFDNNHPGSPGFRIRLTEDQNKSLKLKPLTIPTPLHEDFWEKIKSFYYSHKNNIDSKYSSNSEELNILRDKMIIGLYRYLDSEQNLNKTDCANFIQQFAKKVNKNFYPLTKKRVLQILGDWLSQQ